jgi:hypothetical protein
MAKWEYTTIRFKLARKRDREKAMGQFDTLGDEGWELVNFAPISKDINDGHKDRLEPDGYRAIFKRRK